MRISEIVRVDAKGRVTIPLIVREALNIMEGMTLVMIADPDKREIILSPLPSREGSLYELRMEFKDVPGALAKASEKLAELGIDQVTTQCATMKRGEYAECIIVIDMENSNVGLDEVKKTLSSMPEVRFLQLRPLRH